MLWPSPVLNYCCITILQQLYLDICHAHLICQYQKIIGCQGAETLHFYCLYGIGFSACDLCSCSWSVDYIRMFYSQLTGCKYNHHHHMKSKCGHMVTTAVLLSHHHHMDLDHIFYVVHYTNCTDTLHFQGITFILASEINLYLWVGNISIQCRFCNCQFYYTFIFIYKEVCDCESLDTCIEFMCTGLICNH